MPCGSFICLWQVIFACRQVMGRWPVIFAFGKWYAFGVIFCFAKFYFFLRERLRRILNAQNSLAADQIYCFGLKFDRRSNTTLAEGQNITFSRKAENITLTVSQNITLAKGQNITEFYALRQFYLPMSSYICLSSSDNTFATDICLLQVFFALKQVIFFCRNVLFPPHG